MRYRLYGEWEKDDEKLPMILAARQTAKVVYSINSGVYFISALSLLAQRNIFFYSMSSFLLPNVIFFYQKLETRRILKRLAKENLKQLGRMVAKLAHANPMTVLRTIVNQVYTRW